MRCCICLHKLVPKGTSKIDKRPTYYPCPNKGLFWHTMSNKEEAERKEEKKK